MLTLLYDASVLAANPKIKNDQKYIDHQTHIYVCVFTPLPQPSSHINYLKRLRVFEKIAFVVQTAALLDVLRFDAKAVKI